MFRVELMARAKALRLEQPWHIQGMEKGPVAEVEGIWVWSLVEELLIRSHKPSGLQATTREKSMYCSEGKILCATTKTHIAN